MSLLRTALLWMSRNETLKTRLPQFGFVKRAVRRFMPGETLEDALRAAEHLREKNIPTILTILGENVDDLYEAEAEMSQYLHVLDEIKEHNLDCYISVKLTHLGFDIDRDRCYAFFAQLAGHARELNNMVWIDMEGSAYTEATIVFYERALKEFDNVGLCLQSYLYRTGEDVKRLLPHKPFIRLVKGAYREPSTIAMTSKAEVNVNYLRLAFQLLHHTREAGNVHGIGTHDGNIEAKVIEEVHRTGMNRDRVEFQMLYGIQTAEQHRLAREGYRIRALISYGTYWYPWYMRRLAERPANVWFVLKNLLAR